MMVKQCVPDIMRVFKKTGYNVENACSGCMKLVADMREKGILFVTTVTSVLFSDASRTFRRLLV